MSVTLMQTATDRTTPILHLLAYRRPTAVGRFVIAVVVDAIDRVRGRRTRTHIGVESLKGIAPALTDRDATAAVIGPSFAIRIRAAVNDAIPRFVLSGRSVAACVAVCAECFAGAFALVAPTTAVFAHSEVTSAHSHNMAADTLALPSWPSAERSISGDYKQPTELLAGEIDEPRHSLIIPQTMRLSDIG